MAANIDGIAEPMRFDELSTFDGVAQRTCSLADPLWSAGAILYKAHVDPPGTGSST
jgi:hypothetical protein